jgi:hypothetical protein
MGSQIYGTRPLPPPELLPGEIRDTIAAYSGALDAARRAKAAVGEQRRVGLAQAKARDLEAGADALEAGKGLPAPTYQQKARDKLAALERNAESAELVAERCRVRMDTAITDSAEEIAAQANVRLQRARNNYLAALDAVEEAAGDLATAAALVAWVRDPQSSWKLRAVMAPLPASSESRQTVNVLLGAMRQAVEPARRKPVPSPFSVPADDPRAKTAPAPRPAA